MIIVVYDGQDTLASISMMIVVIGMQGVVITYVIVFNRRKQMGRQQWGYVIVMMHEVV